MSENIYWVLRVILNDGQEEAFEPLMAEMVESTKAETGAVAYEWYRDGKAVDLFENYASNADAMIHMQNFGANFAKRFMTVFTPAAFDVYGPVEEDLRAALAPVGAVFHTKVGGFAR